MKTKLRWVVALGLVAGFVGKADGQFSYRTNSQGIVITGYRGTNGVVTIPTVINGFPVVEIGTGAFRENAKITNISIPYTVEKIGDNAFYHCAKLVTVTVGNGVTRIGNNAFYLCTGLRGVYFTGNAPGIGAWIFAGANNAIVYQLSSTIGWQTTYGGRPVLLWRSQGPFEFAVNQGTVTITRYTGSRKHVVIPEQVNLLPIKCIGDGAFAGTTISSVAIPDSVKTIGSAAFLGCSGLTNLDLPDSVAKIGPQAFQECHSLLSVKLPSRIRCLPDSLFALCNNLTNVFIPDGVTDIGVAAFADSGLRRIVIPDSVTDLGHAVFLGCDGLREVTIGNGITTIPDITFKDCGLSEIRFGTNVATIGAAAFTGCAGLRNLTIPDSVTYIGGNAFGYCWNLVHVSLGHGLTNIDTSAFMECSSLTSIYLPDSVKQMGSLAFEGCYELSSVRLPRQIQFLWGSVFSRCYSLTNISIPEGVMYIENAAFAHTGLRSVVIPSSIRFIASDAFSDCPGLQAVYFKGDGTAQFDLPNGNHSRVYYLPGRPGWGSTFGGWPTALWLPEIKADDANFDLRMNQFGFTIDWTSGMTVVVEASTNLNNGNWQPVQTNTLTSDSLYFSDPGWTNYSSRFYRVSWQ
jgi:BspA type Leucine rich repeat region (6 copies)